MKRFSRLAGETFIPCPSFHSRLKCYALQAGAAGVGLLALTQPSEATIVYTPAHHVIRNGGSYRLDLNNDGITDLTFQTKYFRTCGTSGFCVTSEKLAAEMAGDNQVVHNVFGAVAMKPGMRIGPKDSFDGGAESMVGVGNSTSDAKGSWVNVNSRYLGVKFKINGETHYGWARLSVRVEIPLRIIATLTGYAYETVPNKSIIAGKTKGYDESDGQPEAILSAPGAKPATLGLLAMGAPALPIWRREQLAGVAE